MSLESVPPKYAQLVTELQRRIESGQYPPGSAMPSEHMLIAEFDVSRPTVVAALRVLRDQGWIDSRQGKGRFVRGRPALASLENARAGQVRLAGSEAAVPGEVLAAGVVDAPNRVRSLLGLGSFGKAFLRRRLLTADGAPSELLSLWLPLDLAESTNLTSAEPLKQGVRQHLESRKGVKFDHVVEHIVARMPTGEEVDALSMRTGTPVLVVYATARDAAGRPLMVVDTVLPADLHELEDAYPLA
ncbi:GntR family transcriptional regulator [Actinomadura decatromicini]|uniref:GntR family transcriptional regulator n=1 Tax=Actinomadura decatromicini TaxID=2604572 RepID=A0A5D3FTZ7_9ACTN|nr:GntR family transcriptional regulator [Actinomadura decatromicini]TYK50585.1 GntR family transcriptional regulator [Actinomadura decatromicini]